MTDGTRYGADDIVDDLDDQYEEEVGASDHEVEFDLDASTANGAGDATSDRFQILGADGLSLRDTNDLVGAAAANVVLIAGEVNSGKTTFLVELFAQFLEGKANGWGYAGSRTLAGFHRRHKTARVSSGSRTATTARTQDDEPRHLHLGIARLGRRVDLVLSDLRGELFEGIIDGHAVHDELPFVGRVDKCLILIDGADMRVRSTRELQLMRAEQLIEGLIEPGGLRASTDMAIVCTKIDMMTEEVRLLVMQSIADLALRVSGPGRRAITAQGITARPADGSPPIGIAELLDYLASPVERVVPVPSVSVNSGRYFWRGES